MDFMIGCNYWASHAGTDMWRDWDENVVENDLKILSENGIKYMRVFPNWRDFQPVMPMFCGGGGLWEYRLEGELFPENFYYLDELMLKRFSQFCQLCDKYNLKLIVGLITGWMSGRLFIPSALYGKNLYSDSTALMFEQLFIKGFVSRFKEENCIYAWDLGNECNCMSRTEGKQETAAMWTALISNAIKANDSTRPIVSGMHSIGVENDWRIVDQAEHCDYLTTHPYPYWVQHCNVDKINSLRTMLHATCETIYYSSIGKKPCIAEEIGTMGPMQGDDDATAGFMRVNLYSNWANGASGVMWWCAHEQSNLSSAPYSWNMVERELGLLDSSLKPKPVLNEIKNFSEWIKRENITLPLANKDAVCILTQSQDQWGVAYITYILSKQAGVNINYSYCTQEIPESSIYMLPSIKGNFVLPKEKYDELKKRVFEGAELYISSDGGIITEFELLTGLKVISHTKGAEKSFCIDEEELYINSERYFNLKPTNAKVLIKDNDGNVVLSKNQYGKGKVYYVNFPLESMLLNKADAFKENWYQIYSKVFKNTIDTHIIKSSNPYIAITTHQDKHGVYAVIINYSEDNQVTNIVIDKEYSISKIYRGEDISLLKPYECAVVLLEK